MMFLIERAMMVAVAVRKAVLKATLFERVDVVEFNRDAVPTFDGKILVVARVDPSRVALSALERRDRLADNVGLAAVRFIQSTVSPCLAGG